MYYNYYDNCVFPVNFALVTTETILYHTGFLS